MLANRHITALMHNARLRGREGNWIASLNIYNRIIEQQPDFLPAYCELSRLYLDRDDFEGARELLAKVLDVEPESTEAHFLLGVIEYIEGNFEAALKSYRAVEKVDGLDCNLAMNIALVCEALGLHKDAIKNLEHALAHGEGSAKVYEVLADLYRATGDLESAVQVLEKALRKFPRDASVHFNLGLTYLRAGNYLKTEASLAAASKLAPEELGPLEELASLYMKLHRLEDAASVLARLTRLEPENVQNWLRLARAWYALDSYKKSADVLREARRIFPDNASINKEFESVVGRLSQMEGEQEAPGGEGREQQR